MQISQARILRTLCGFGVCSVLAWGQQPPIAVNVSWLPVTDAEKSMTAPMVDKDAGVEALFWRVHVRDEIVGGTEVQRVLYHYVRLKIFSEKGMRDAATIEIPYTSENTVLNVAGRTIQADGMIVELKGSDIHDKEVVKIGRIRRKVKSFAMPAVAPGAIVEYRWREVRFDPSTFYFRAQMQREFPVQKVTYFLRPLTADQTTYQMAVRPFNCQPSKLHQEPDGFHSMSLEKVPAFREEPLMPGEPNVRPWVLVFYSDGSQKNPDKYWEGEGKDAYRRMKLSMKVNDDIRAAATKAVAGAQNDNDKVIALIRHVRKNLRSIYSSSVTDAERANIVKQMPKTRRRTSEEVFKSGIGFPNELNILFAAMASAVGLETRQAFLGDRDDLTFHPSLADIYYLSNIDMAVNSGGKWKLYDVTARLLAPSMLTWREEGTLALISDPKKPEFVETGLSSPDDSVTQRIGRFELKADGSLEGTVGMAYTGHKAHEERLSLDGDSPEKQQEGIKEQVMAVFPDAEVSSIVIEDADDPEKPLKIRYAVRIPGYAQRTGKRILFQPLFFQRGETPLFGANERMHAVHFRYGWKELDSITLKWPEGFQLDSAENPGGINFGPPGEYSLEMGKAGDRELRVSRGLTFGKGGLIIYPQTAYSPLKRGFDEIHRRDETTLVLKEAASGVGAQ